MKPSSQIIFDKMKLVTHTIVKCIKLGIELDFSDRDFPGELENLNVINFASIFLKTFDYFDNEDDEKIGKTIIDIFYNNFGEIDNRITMRYIKYDPWWAPSGGRSYTPRAETLSLEIKLSILNEAIFRQEDKSLYDPCYKQFYRIYYDKLNYNLAERDNLYYDFFRAEFTSVIVELKLPLLENHRIICYKNGNHMGKLLLLWLQMMEKYYEEIFYRPILRDDYYINYFRNDIC